MFPINFVEYYTRGFGKDVLELAQKQGTAVLAIKPLSWGTWPKEGKRTREWWYRSVGRTRGHRVGDAFYALAAAGDRWNSAFVPGFADHTIEAASKVRAT